MQESLFSHSLKYVRPFIPTDAAVQNLQYLHFFITAARFGIA